MLGAQLTELKRVRAVAQYMYKELQVVPWTLTANYIKRHGISASPVSEAVDEARSAALQRSIRGKDGPRVVVAPRPLAAAAALLPFACRAVH